MTVTAMNTEVSREELQGLLDAQRAAQAADPVPDAATRRDRMDRFVAAVLEHATDLADALNADFGNRPATTSLELDILSGLPDIAVAREQIDAWMAPTPLPAGIEGAVPAVIQTRPKGVVGVIGPWNFPVLLVFVPAAEALAAGNRVMIKFSDMTPRTGEVFARAVASRMSPDEVTVVNGGVQTATDFADLRFDHIFFTGSPKVGRLVGAAAGKNLVPVTLELGGKNPAIVAPDADVAEAAARIAAGRLINNGQVCLCPDYAFVPESGKDAFVEAYRQAALAHFPTFIDNPDVVSVVNDANYARVSGLIDDAKAKGATEIVIVPDDERDRVPGQRGPPDPADAAGGHRTRRGHQQRGDLRPGTGGAHLLGRRRGHRLRRSGRASAVVLLVRRRHRPTSNGSSSGRRRGPCPATTPHWRTSITRRRSAASE